MLSLSLNLGQFWALCLLVVTGCCWWWLPDGIEYILSKFDREFGHGDREPWWCCERKFWWRFCMFRVHRFSSDPGNGTHYVSTCARPPVDRHCHHDLKKFCCRPMMKIESNNYKKFDVTLTFDVVDDPSILPRHSFDGHIRREITLQFNHSPLLPSSVSG